MQAAPFPFIFKTSGHIVPGLSCVCPEPSKYRGNWTVHVATPIGKGTGRWNTLLWRLDEASKEIDMVYENLVELHLFL